MGSVSPPRIKWPVSIEGVQYATRDELLAAPLPERLRPHLSALTDPTQDEILLHTSGSTGEPRPIRAPWACALASAQATAAVFGLQAGDRILLALDAEPVGGRMMIVRALHLGLDLCACEPASLPSRPTADEKFAFTSLVPRQASQIARHAPHLFSRMGTILLGGGPVDPFLESELAALGHPFWHGYGMTETLSHVALRRLGNGPQYRAVPGVTFAVSEGGTLIIEAPQALANPLVTTDLVTLHNPDTFTWLGRADFLINTGGVKVSPESIEAELAPQLPGREFFIGSLPHPEWGEQVVLYLVGDPVDINSLTVSHPAHRPKQCLPVSRIESTKSGKPLRRVNP